MFTEMMMSAGGGGNIKAAKGVIRASDWIGTGASATATVTGLGFKPSHVSVFSTSTNHVAYVYDENVSTTKYSGAQGTSVANFKDMTSNSLYGQFSSIDADGFTLIRYGNNYTSDDIYWAAVE